MRSFYIYLTYLRVYIIIQKKGCGMQGQISRGVEIFSFIISNFQIVVIKDDTFCTTENVSSAIDQTKSIHFHLEHELFFIKNGNATIHLENGEESFSNSTLIVPSHLIHYSTLDSGNYRLLFKVEPLNNRDLCDSFSKTLNHNEIVCLPLSSNTQFYLTEIEKAFCNASVDKEKKITSLLTLLFIELFENLLPAQQSDIQTPLNLDQTLIKIDSIINREYNLNITLKSLAKKIFLSTKQTSRIIKKHYGVTFTKLVNLKRISIAKKLLVDTDLSVSKIAQLSGFETENYFFSTFKKHYGVTPLKYRKQRI